MKKLVCALLLGIVSLAATAQETTPPPKDSRFDKIIKYIYKFPGTPELVLEGENYNIQFSIPEQMIVKAAKDPDAAKFLSLSNEQRTGAWVSIGVAAGLLIPAYFFTFEIPKKQTSGEVWTSAGLALSFCGGSLVASIIGAILQVQGQESLFKGINHYNEFVLSN